MVDDVFTKISIHCCFCVQLESSRLSCLKADAAVYENKLRIVLGHDPAL